MLQDVAEFVRPLAFGVVTVVASVGHGAYFCSAYGGEIFVCDRSRNRMVVYRDGVVQRTFGQDVDLNPMGSAVTESAVFVADNLAHAVKVYAAGGGERLRSFPASDLLKFPWGIAASDGLVYVSETEGNRRVTVFREDGTYVAHSGIKHDNLRGLAVVRDRVFVAHRSGLHVFTAGDLTSESAFGRGLANCRDLDSLDGVLFVGTIGHVVALDLADGHVLASVKLSADPSGVAVLEDGTLFVTVQEKFAWRMVAMQLS